MLIEEQRFRETKHQPQDSVKMSNISGADNAVSPSIIQTNPLLGSDGSAPISNATLDSSALSVSGLIGPASTQAVNNTNLLQSDRVSIDRGSTDLELLLRLEAIRNTEHQAHSHLSFNQDDSRNRNFNGESFNDVSASLLQQYAKQQQQQQQTLLASQLQQLRQPHQNQLLMEMDAARLQQPYTGIMNNYSNSPGLTAGTNVSSLLGYAQRSQIPQNPQQEQLLAALLSKYNENSAFLPQSNYAMAGTSVDPAQFFPSSLPPNTLLDRNYLLSGPQQTSISVGSTSQVVAGMSISGRATNLPPNSSHSSEEVATCGKREFEEQTPVRALSAYNFFFRYERERILNSNDDEIEAQPDFSKEKQQELLDSHWSRDRTVKRRHRKSHGKISFAELSKRISQRWKDLPEAQKNFFSEVAAKDWERYHREVEQQKRLGQLPIYKKSR